jgi:hypothetical protein
MKIDFDDINKIKIDNIVNYLGNIYTIYDIEDDILYLKTPDNSNLGVPLSEIRPILLTDKVMELCGFNLIEEPTTKYIGQTLVQTKTPYRLFKEEYGIDMSVIIVIDYEWEENDMFLVKTFDKIDQSDKKVRWLHQIQNIFKSIYGIELVSIN